MHRVVLLVLTTLVVALVAAPAAAAQPPPPRPPWGACGNSTPEDKVVRRFPGGITLRCGGPIYSPDPRYGYRHVLARHRSDFENMVAETGAFENWRDLADFAIETIALDPDRTAPAAAGQTCLSRVIFLNNRQIGQPMRQQIVVMYINAATRDINTVTSRDRQC